MSANPRCLMDGGSGEDCLACRLYLAPALACAPDRTRAMFEDAQRPRPRGACITLVADKWREQL